jgi:hypothetical protein
MAVLPDRSSKSQSSRLLAIVEIVDDEGLKIFPVADNDADERRILDAFVREGLRE